MKICVDIQPLVGRKTGVGYYTENLLRSLSELDHHNDYSLVAFKFFTSSFTPPLNLKAPNFRYRVIKFLPGRIFGKLLKLNLLPPLDLLLGKRLYLFPNFVSWPLLFSPSAVIIYDLSYVLHSQYSDEANRRFLTKFVPRSLKRASLVITISENSKREIVEHYGTDPKKIVIAYPAIDPAAFKPAAKSELQRVAKKFDLPADYLLYVGTLEPRKNIIGILDAYAALPKEIRQKHALVLAGGKGWKDDSIGQRLTALQGAGERIIQTGYFDEEDLLALYSGATAFIYPSHYEGFGMPPLEAMACGTPVITSDNSSLPEVVGKAGLMIKADDTAALTQAIHRVVSDPKQAETMRKAGIEQAKLFRWEDGAKTVLKAMETVKRP